MNNSALYYYLSQLEWLDIGARVVALIGIVVMMYLLWPRGEQHYDEKFDTYIRKLKPGWFADTATGAKQQLLAMARNGEGKPALKHPLNVALCNYTNLNHNSYDPEFDKQIRKLKPSWFATTALQQVWNGTYHQLVRWLLANKIEVEKQQLLVVTPTHFRSDKKTIIPNSM